MPEISRGERAAYLRQLIFGQDWPSNFSTMNTIVVNDNANDWDFRIEANTNPNIFVTDGGLFGGVGQLSIGSIGQTTATAFTRINNPATTAVANQPFAKLLIDNSAATTIPTGTSAVATSLRIEEPNLTATGTVTVGATAYFVDAPTEGTNNYTIFVDNGRSRFDTAVTVASAASAAWDGFAVPADTLTITGSTGITTATGVNLVAIGRPTLSAASALTVTNAATMYVANAPTGAGAGPATITNAYTLWLDDGAARFDGRVLTAKGANVASAGTLTLGTDGFAFTITGTTTINYITTTGFTSGSIIVLAFTGIVTVAHNTATPPANTAPLLLSGAANMSATADDTLTLFLDGANWREIARTVI